MNELDDNGYGALHHAAFNGNLAIVQLLVLYGAKVNQRSKKGETPLFLASKNGHIAVIWVQIILVLMGVKKNFNTPPLKEYPICKRDSEGTEEIVLTLSFIWK